jgi:hypothetical protein
MTGKIKKTKKPRKLIDYLGVPSKKIDYSPSIFHFRQTGQQCWARSSQMFLSYILHVLGLSKDEITLVFYENLFLKKYDEHDYLELNQYLLGRRLKPSEKVIFTLDGLFLKMYSEFGSTAFSAEVFAAFIKNYLQMFSKITGRFQSAIITLIIDNDKDEEIFKQANSCTMIYRSFNLETDSKLTTGILSGVDKEPWMKLTEKGKINLLSDLIAISPILAEVPGHAFVISGINESDSVLIINDSLSNNVYKTPLNSNLNSLTALVMLTRIKL